MNQFIKKELKYTCNKRFVSQDNFNKNVVICQNKQDEQNFKR